MSLQMFLQTLLNDFIIIFFKMFKNYSLSKLERMVSNLIKINLFEAFFVMSIISFDNHKISLFYF